MSLSARINQGNIRVGKLHTVLQMQYQGVPNRNVLAHYGMGTGCDIIVWQYSKTKPKILELREVLNWDKFTRQGKKEEADPNRKKDLITSLTRSVSSSSLDCPSYRAWIELGFSCNNSLL